MGIFGALITSVSGLRSQAFALENISGNIANSQTTGFKRTDTSFSDLVAGAVPKRQVSGGVMAFSRSTNTLQGDLQNSSIDTFMAINGEGFFAVQKPGNFVDGRPVFEGVDLFTRRGDFELDRDGYLVNGSGYYLKAMRVDPTTGNLVGSVAEVIQFQNDFLPARVTSEIEYRANLATYPLTAAADPDVSGSELINPTYFWSNPIASSATPATITGRDAAIQADAAAVLTGNTDIGALISAGGTLRINGVNIAITAGDNAAAIEAAIDTETANTGVAASINGTGRLVLTSVNTVGPPAVTAADRVINVEAASTLAVLNELGIISGVTNPTNLLTQGAVGEDNTLTVQIGSGAVQTITFGTGAGEVSTLAELTTALGGLANVATAIDANGNITLTAQNTVDTITVGGTATLARFGMNAGTAMSSNGTVRGVDETTFISQSVSGGAITTYDVNGSPVNIQFRWAKSASITHGGQDTWHLFYQSNSNAGNTEAAWTQVPQVYRFNASGQLNPPIASVIVPGVTVNNVAVGDVVLNHGTGGLTQFADPNGNVSVTRMQQNGYPAGDLVDIAVSDRGRILANYSNGRSAEIAEIPLYSFYGPNQLKKIDGGAFSQTAESGPPVSDAGGSILGKTLEGSNTDIADEFTKMIVTQQAYAANTRVVTTANEMLQEVLQMSR